MPKVLIVEDQQLIRQGLIALLSLEDEITIVGEAENGQQALTFLEKLAPKALPEELSEALPDVALMDIRMPIMDGVATTQILTQRYPTIKVLVLTTFDDDELIAQAMAVGAKGYLLKDTPSEEVAMAIRAVAKGHSHFGPGIVQKMMGALPRSLGQGVEGRGGGGQGLRACAEGKDSSGAPTLEQDTQQADIEALTPREKEVFTHLGKGSSNREIAKALYISEGTVKNHVTRILSQLGLRDRTQAALLAQSSQHSL